VTAPAVEAPRAAAALPVRANVATLRLAMQAGLHPETGLHASWLPDEWPCRHRRLDRLSASAQAMVGQVLVLRGLVRRGVAPRDLDLAFATRVERLALLESKTLRGLAFYLGAAVHRDVIQERSRLGSLLRRKLRGLDPDAAAFLRDRVPWLSAFSMAAPAFLSNRHGAARVIVERGYRLLLGLAARGGAATLDRVRLKLPRRMARLPVPELTSAQATQLDELVFLCLIPERFASWDWLF
jgi:type III secretion protein K